MSALANWLADNVRKEVADRALGGEARLTFHGPCLEILEKVYENLVAGAPPEGLPVVLLVPVLPTGCCNPAIGQSGRCNESHLLDLRNSPARPSYLALVPPGQQSIRSVSSTSDEFGMSMGTDSDQVDFEEWIGLPFVQQVMEAGLTATGVAPSLLGEARTIVRRALGAVDDVDLRRHERCAAWRLLSRLFSSSGLALSPSRRISLACGVPPMDADMLSNSQQHTSLDGVASALSDGFSTGLEEAKERAAAASSTQLQWLEDFQKHIRACDVPTALERSPEAFYSPDNGLEVGTPPDWWSGLTADLWAELLSDKDAIIGDLRITCSNPLLHPTKGVPILVRDEVQLNVQVGAEGDQPVPVSVTRSPKGAAGYAGTLEVNGDAPVWDEQPPPHRAPIQYKMTAEGFRPASARVVSLATWQPGIFVACKLAQKTTAPKAPARRGRGGPHWETSLALPGPGRYEILVFLSPGGTIKDKAIGTASGEHPGGEEEQDLSVREVQGDLYQMEVEADGSYQIDISFGRRQPDGNVVPELCRVFLVCEEVEDDGCDSEFERLISLNRRHLANNGGKAVVLLDRSVRTSSLQGWILQEDSAEHSFLPLVLSDDYSSHWMQPNWEEPTGRGRIISSGAFHIDPRPSSHLFQPPSAFVTARKALAALIRGVEDQTGLVESAPVGEWLARHDTFPQLVEEYLDAYTSWLKSNPEVAPWVDVVAVCSLDSSGRTLSRVPDAIMLSPLHPLRLAWHAVAQRTLWEAAEGQHPSPCPAAGILDPGMIPDVLKMPLSSPEGVDWVPFLAVESNSDYWSVMWNGNRLSQLPERSRKPPFDNALGLSIGGVSTGFSVGQVKRALDDVSGLLCAKPLVSVTVASSGAATDSCNEGLMAWARGQFATAEDAPDRSATGPRRLDIFDSRPEILRPEDARIANLSEDTSNRVRWFLNCPPGTPLDLGIVAQLDSSEPAASHASTQSAIGAGGLIRHRIRRQLPNAFLSESRQAGIAEPSGDPLADKVAACLGALENLGNEQLGLCFAPDVHQIGELLESKQADFVAVSSSAVDPACFLGGWLPNSYLWDYDLPSYSQRAGDTNGYYLLSRVKPSDLDGLRKVLTRLPGCGTLGDEETENILKEVARRGIPTIRGLSGDDSGAVGDLGLFVASRLLQDRFRIGACPDSLLPVFAGTGERAEIALVMPVDPFRGYLDDLARALHKGRTDFPLNRPDLLVACATLDGPRVRIHLTPVEVKCRLGQQFPTGEVAAALGQARALADLLRDLAGRPAELAKLPGHSSKRLSIWRLAYQHLLLAMVGFGMRVYSQHQDVTGVATEWASLHERIANAILGDDLAVTVDRRGRLIIVDDSIASSPRDHDGDGFPETIVIGCEDAGRIVAGDAQAFYQGVHARIGSWGFPAPIEPPPDHILEGDRGERTAEPDGTVHVPAASSAAQPMVFPEVTAGLEPPVQATPPQVEPVGSPSGVIIEVGTTVDNFEPRKVSLSLSDTRLNQLNMGVVGDLGTGKTQLLKSLVRQMATSGPSNRGIRPRILIFDYKRDYSSPDFISATGGRVVRPRNLPLNLFDTSAIGESQTPWLERFQFFADVLDKIYSGVGPVQRANLKGAVRSAYQQMPSGSPPTIYDVHAAYATLLGGRVDAPMGIIDDLVDMQVFEPDASKTKPFDEFLDGVVVIALDQLGQNDRSKHMLVAILLNMFYENMLRTVKQPFLGSDPQLRAINSYLLVDEADNIMQYEFDVLRKLLLQGREFGCGVILASQYLRHFKAGATDYREPLLTWFIHKVPNITAGELGALGLAATAAEVAERVKILPNHHCLYKSFDSPGMVIHGLPFYELVARDGVG